MDAYITWEEVNLQITVCKSTDVNTGHIVLSGSAFTMTTQF